MTWLVDLRSFREGGRGDGRRLPLRRSRRSAVKRGDRDREALPQDPQIRHGNRLRTEYDIDAERKVGRRGRSRRGHRDLRWSALMDRYLNYAVLEREQREGHDYEVVATVA